MLQQPVASTNTLSVPQRPQDRSPAIMQHLKSIDSPSSSPALQGRVFERLQHFAALPANLQEDTKQFQAFAEQNTHMLFETNHHALVIPVYSIKGEALVNAIIQWLQECAASPATSPIQTSGPPATTMAPAPKTPLAKVARGTIYISSELLSRAKQIAAAMLLSGFLTPYIEDEITLKHPDGSTPLHYVHDHELLVPVGKDVAEFCTTTVWSVADGAIYARYLKRKTGLFAQCSGGKDIYVVLNKRTQKAYLFASDIARESITEIVGETMNVQFDSERFTYGVRVALNSGFDQRKTELFNAESKQVQEEFVNAWLAIGAQYRDGKIKEMLV